MDKIIVYTMTAGTLEIFNDIQLISDGSLTDLMLANDVMSNVNLATIYYPKHTLMGQLLTEVTKDINHIGIGHYTRLRVNSIERSPILDKLTIYIGIIE